MRCFYHQDQEAVGICRSCGKAICAACVVDLGKGLACRGRCEEHAQAIIRLVDHNIQHISPAKAQVFVAPVVQRPIPPTNDHTAVQLTAHIRETILFRRLLGVLTALIGVVLLASDSEIVGACFMVFAIICLVGARRLPVQPARPQAPTTETR